MMKLKNKIKTSTKRNTERKAIRFCPKLVGICFIHFCAFIENVLKCGERKCSRNCFWSELFLCYTIQLVFWGGYFSFFLLLSAWDLSCKAKLFVRSPIHFIRLQFARHHIKGIYAFKAFKVLIQTNVSVVALPQNNDGNAYCFRIPTTMMTFENIFRYLHIWKWWLYLALWFHSDISFSILLLLLR